MVSKYTVVFSENLKEIMKERGWNLAELSRQVGIREQTLSRYLRCEHEVTLVYLCKIADFFNEDIDILVGRREY